MNRRFFIFFLSLLLAHVPLAFAPGDSDSENEGVPPCAPRKPSAQITEVAPESQRPAKRQRLTAEQATQTTVAVFQPTGQPSDQAGALSTAASEASSDKLVILREVFQFLTFDEMKNCRLVCKQWNKAATYALSLQPRLRLTLPPFATNPHAKTFLTHLQKNAAVKAWVTPDNPLPLTWNDDTPLVLGKLRPESVTLTLPEGVDLPAAHLASVRHLYLSAPQIPITSLDALAAMCLYTLNLAEARFFVVNNADDPAWAKAFLQLTQLPSLIGLNLSKQKMPTTFLHALATRPLQTLNLAGARFRVVNPAEDPSLGDALLQLAQMASLTKLNLSNQELPTTFLHALATMPLQTLNLARARFRVVNPLQDPSLGDALLQLGQMASLTNLNLSNQELPTTLFSALATRPLQTLNLAGARVRLVNPLQDPSWEAALLQLGQMASLTNLNLSNQELPTTLFSALAQLPLTTLNLASVTLAIENEGADPSYYEAISQLRHLSALTHLNLAQLQEENNDEGLGDIIWYHTCQQLGLPDRDDSLGPEHLQALINNNPLHYLAHLETLNLEGAGFRGHWQFLETSAQTLKILNFSVKGDPLGQAQPTPLNLLENLEELTTSSLDWFVGEEEPGVQHNAAPSLQSTSKLRVLDLKNSGLENTHLRRLRTLQNVEELNILACHLTGKKPGEADENALQQQGHLLLDHLPLKTLTADYNLSLHCVPVLRQPLLLTHLSLRYCGLQSLEGLNSLVSLKHLNISNNAILVSEAWRHMTNLKQLRILEFSQNILPETLFHDTQAHAACMQVLEQNTQLRKLDLAGQALGPKGAGALTNLHCLESLSLGYCDLGDDGFKALPLLRLQTLKVSTNNLTAESAKHLCETLQQVTLPHLNVLNLAANPLGDDAMEYLASLKSLKVLDVMYVDGTTAGMQKLLPLVPQLTNLFCGGNDLSAELNATFAAVNHNG